MGQLTMRYPSDDRRFLPLLAGVATLLPAVPVWAGSPALTGLAAVANTAESAFNVPAGMSRLEGTRYTAQGLVAKGLGSFDVDEASSTYPGGDPNSDNAPVIVPALYYVRELNDRWHAGVSLTIPSGFGTSYGNSWSGRYHAVDFSLVYIALTPAFSYRVTDSFFVGGGMGLNYTAQNSEQKLRFPGGPEGKMTSAMSGIGVNFKLSAMYEFSPQTRVGVAFTSQSDADMEGSIKLRRLPQVVGDAVKALGVKSNDVKVQNKLPEHVLAGAYHQFDSGNFVTADTVWVKFSDFATTDLEFDGIQTDIGTPRIYNDIYALSLGFGMPANACLTYKFGAVYVSQGVDDDDRTLAISIDEMWGVGAGLTYEMAPGKLVDANLTLMNTGKAPVDTGDQPVLGRVVGKTQDPWSLLFEMTYSF